MEPSGDVNVTPPTMDEESSSDANYSDLEFSEASSGDTENAGDHSSDDIEQLEEEALVVEYHRFVKAYTAERKTRQGSLDSELLVSLLYTELSKLNRHNWHKREGKLASLVESVKDLMELISVSQKNMRERFQLQWFDTLDPSSSKLLQGDKLKVVLEEAIDLGEEDEVNGHTSLLSQCRVIVYFLRRAFRKDNNSDTEEAEVEDLYKFCLSYEPDEEDQEWEDDLCDRPYFLHSLALELNHISHSTTAGNGRWMNHLHITAGCFGLFCSDHEELKRLHKWLDLCSHPSSSAEDVHEAIKQAVDHATTKDKNDDMLKKRCRLVVRFLHLVYGKRSD